MPNQNTITSIKQNPIVLVAFKQDFLGGAFEGQSFDTARVLPWRSAVSLFVEQDKPVTDEFGNLIVNRMVRIYCGPEAGGTLGSELVAALQTYAQRVERYLALEAAIAAAA